MTATGQTFRYGASKHDQLAELDDLARLLDTRWSIPGTNIRFGVDAVAGLIPGLGDAATGVVSAYMIYRAHQLGVPSHVKARMIGNVVLDTVVGSVPLLGSIFDVYFKANKRNMVLMHRHFDRAADHARSVR